MAPFDPPRVTPSARATKESPAPDPDFLRREIQKLRDAAQVRGHAEGYAAGHAQGISMGTEEGHRDGHAQGYAAGLEAGHQAGSEEARQAVIRLTSLADECAASVACIEEDMGQALIALSIRIAEQILHTTLDTQPEKIVDLVRNITHLDNDKDGNLKLRLHPDDVSLVQKYLSEEAGIGQWRTVPDSSIQRGGCRAETALGEIDATLQARWERVTWALGHKSPLGKKP